MSSRGFFSGLLTITAVSLVLFWVVGVLGNGDPLWFQRAFNGYPTSIVVYWDGQIHTLTPQDEGFAEIAQAFATGVAHWSGYDGKVVLSEESLARYHTEWRMLEINYAVAARVHTRYPFPPASTYLIPLNYTHANYRRVFGYHHVVPWAAGSLNLDEADFAALAQAVEHALASQ